MISSKLIVVFLFFIGLVCAKIAQKKNRSEHIWFFLGVFFGLLALGFIYFLQPIKKVKSLESNFDLYLIKKDTNYWYYLDEDQNQVGPMSLKALFDNYKLKKISEITFVWNDTMENWKRLNETTVFSKFFKNLPAGLKNSWN